MTATKNLMQRINEVRSAVSYIQKDKAVSTGGSSYKAVTHDLVTAVVRGHMITAGIVSYPVLVASKMNPPAIGPDGVPAKQARYEATYDIHFINADDPKDEIICRIEAHAMDNADKAPGKALSYAKKYAVLKLFELETGEDEESRVPEEFNVEPFLVKIRSAKDMDSLKAAYAEGFTAAGQERNKFAQQQVIKAKDDRKKELEVAA